MESPKINRLKVVLVENAKIGKIEKYKTFWL